MNIAEYVRRVFTLDLRSLALFRICLSTLILVDLIHRWPTAAEFLTQEGVLTKELSSKYYENVLGPDWNQMTWSLYWISDSPVWSTALLVIAAVSAVFLLVGKWTKLATVVSWFLLASLHTRNPLITSSGDFLFKMMLFWSMFLPLGAQWSLDGRKSKRPEDSVCSIATIAFVVQLIVVYFFPGLAKLNSVWFSGDAMFYVLRLNIYLREFGRYLLNFPGILKVATWATLLAEVLLIWTLLIPRNNSFWRLVNSIVFVGFHIVIAAAMAIGLFPWICIVAWIPLIPTGIWSLFAGEDSALKPNLVAEFDLNLISNSRLAVESFAAISLVIVLVWNLTNIDTLSGYRPALLQRLGYLASIDQHFQMFGDPPKENPWFVYEGLTKSGQSIDIWTENPIDEIRPHSGLLVFPNFHWRKFHRNLMASENKFVRESLLQYVVSRWNKNHPDEGDQLVRARLICFRESIGPKYNGKQQGSHVWGSFRDEQNSAGSLFESILNEQISDPLP